MPVGAEPFDDRLERLYQLVEDVEVVLLTTRNLHGWLVSRPMATQRRSEGAHIWLVTAREMPKVAEIEHDPNVNLAYSRPRAREWVSVSGLARIRRDPDKIHELYEPTWKRWFPKQSGLRNGGPEDPRIVLIAVQARAAHLMTADRPTPVSLFENLPAAAAAEPGVPAPVLR